METEKGVLYGVSVGPGDPELLTLKALRVMESAAVIAAPQTKNGDMLALDIARQAVNLAGKEIVPLCFSMSRDASEQHRAHLNVFKALSPHLDQGKKVALLNLGDVSIYSTFGRVQALFTEAGYLTEMVAGVPSFCAVAARLNQPLTPEMESPFVVAPGSVGLEELLKLPGAKVLMKSGRQLPQVLEQLDEEGLLGQSALVSNCGLPGEQCWPDLSRQRPGEPVGYFATVVVK